jgi:hypothetical protein
VRGRAAGPATGMTAVASRPVGGGRVTPGHGLASVGHPRGRGQAGDKEDRVGPGGWHRGGAAGGQTRAEAVEVCRVVAA